MSFQIEKSFIIPQQPDPANIEDQRRYNAEIAKYLDLFQQYLKKDLSMLETTIGTHTTELADHESRIQALEP